MAKLERGAKESQSNDDCDTAVLGIPAQIQLKMLHRRNLPNERDM